MKQLYFILLLFIFQSFLFGQDSQLYYEGYFFAKNKPQKNLIVTNKTSGNYDFTDDKGYLIIEAKIGDTLVFNKKDFRIVQQYNLKEMKTILDAQIKNQSAIPILSADYRSDFSGDDTADSTDFSKSKIEAKKTGGNSGEIQLIQKSASIYEIKNKVSKNIFYSGSLLISNEFGSPNVQPKVQNQFVQGRNANGILNWNGPETSEMFSFGPHISNLGFDGNPYEFDINGRLVNRSNSTAAAKIYNNSIIQNTQKTSAYFSLNTYYEKERKRKWNANLDLGWVREDLPIKNQYQEAKNFGILLSKTIFENHNLSFTTKLNEQKATNTNRIGLFNRAYQNALLTPISFENSQGNLLTNRQRSYSLFADQPDYLLQNFRKYHYHFDQNIFNLKLSNEYGDFRYSLDQSYENIQFSNFDSYQKFTFGFPSGMETERLQKNKNYNLNLATSYSFNDSYRETSTLYFNAILNQSDTKIAYTNFENYQYNRFTQDYILRYHLILEDFIFDDFKINAEVGNGMYHSNTTQKIEYFIPKVSLGFELAELIDYQLNGNIFGSIYKNVYETDFNKSYSNYLLTQIDNQQLNTYFPTQEIQSVRGLESINTLESKIGIRLFHNRGHFIEGSFTNKNFENDVFPFIQNGDLILKNWANHTTKNYDLSINFQNLPFRRSNLQVSFNKTLSEVNEILGDVQNIPISGFNSIYRGIVKGEALGVLVGTAYARNSNGDLIIGDDGFPLVAAEKKVLGNPIPEFTMKFSYTQNIKNFSLNVDFEWRKGGDIWNGTSANLDYYGRSENSAQQRATSNFIYDGVLQNGNLNTIPVDFFNVNVPFEQNRFYRYGSLGVAEDAIVKGDALRINNIILTYNFTKLSFLKNMKISAFAKNILLWSKNNIDPQTSFFDSENGQGLNFYNLPSMQSYGTSISFIF